MRCVCVCVQVLKSKERAEKSRADHRRVGMSNCVAVTASGKRLWYAGRGTYAAVIIFPVGTREPKSRHMSVIKSSTLTCAITVCNSDIGMKHKNVLNREYGFPLFATGWSDHTRATLLTLHTKPVKLK